MTPREQALHLMTKAFIDAWSEPPSTVMSLGPVLDALLSDEGRPLLLKLLGETAPTWTFHSDAADMVADLKERGVLVPKPDKSARGHSAWWVGPLHRVVLPETEAT